MSAAFVVPPDDQAVLEQWLRSPTVSAAWALRADIVLSLARGEGTRALARRLRVSPTTVCQWKARYAADALAGLQTRARPGRPRTITRAKEQAIVSATMKPPAASTHWSAERLAPHVGVSPSSVLRTWQKFGLQPHRVETFKFVNVRGSASVRRGLVSRS